MNRARWAAAGAAITVALTGAATAAQAKPKHRSYEGRFVETANPHTFGQAPAFMPDGRVISNEDLGKGAGTQLYLAARDGSGQRCLTCSEKAPNMVPQARPQGDWILYHSWRDHHLTVGAPGFGGLGSALDVVRPDGTHVTPLTELDAAHGSGEGEDDYHAYWSPDGRRIVWTHLNWNFVDDSGQGKWDIRVADFVDGPNGPHLANEHVVRPPDGHFYETQWWAPDGSGFLYTESVGTAMNPELFFCRLTPANTCKARRLTYNSAWDEQARFTPDMKDVLFMSSRDHTGAFNTFSAAAQTLGLSPDEDYLLSLPVFEAGFLQPIGGEYTDLYELRLRDGSVRRLTHDGDDGWITPEFTWNPTNRFLMWTELRFRDGVRTPLPPDVRQVQKVIGLLENPPAVDTSTTDLGAVQGRELEKRTRIARFR